MWTIAHLSSFSVTIVHFGVFVVGVDIVSVTCLFKVFCLDADVCGGVPIVS